MNILLIEPDYQLGRTYAAALRAAGHSVVIAAHAQDAIHQADEQKPGLVLLELQLRSHSGVEFMYEFRSYPEWQRIPVILHTVVPEASLSMSKETRQSLGIKSYLYKPQTSLRQLVEAVDEAA